MKRLAIAAILLASCASSDQPLTARRALDRWAEALGGRERLAAIRTIHRTGTITTGGVTGTIETWQTADGKQRTVTDLAADTTIETFDGREGWTGGKQSMPHRLAGPDLENSIAEAYFGSSSEFVSGRRRGTVAMADAKGPYVTLIVKPEGGRETRVLLDPATWLPHAKQQQNQERTSTTTIASWTTVDGVRFPQELVISTGDPRFDTRIAFTKTELNAPAAETMFGKPGVALAAIRFPSGARETSVPFTLNTNHICFPLSVNGSKPLVFVFDSGAEAEVMDSERAEELGLKMTGAFEARGNGPDSLEAAVVANPTLSFGGIDLPLPAISTIPLAPLSVRGGARMDGIVGYQLISRFVVEIDYANQRMRFLDPDAFVPDPHDVALPIEFRGNLPAVLAKITTPDGRTLDARLLVDTGARNAVALNAPFIQRHHIDAGPSVSGPLGAGVGGATNQKIGRLDSFELGGFRFAKPVTSFSTDTAGGAADPTFDGLIGGEIFRRFTLTLDYPHERLLLRPNGAMREPFEYDMSGLLLSAADLKFDRAIVRSILPGSPGADAGIQPGDELVAIDGKPAADLERTRALFREAGKRYTLTIHRNGTPLEVVLITKRMV